MHIVFKNVQNTIPNQRNTLKRHVQLTCYVLKQANECRYRSISVSVPTLKRPNELFKIINESMAETKTHIVITVLIIFLKMTKLLTWLCEILHKCIIY